MLALTLLLASTAPLQAASLSNQAYSQLLEIANGCIANDGVAIYQIDSVQYDPPMALVQFSMGRNGEAGEGRIYLVDDPQGGWNCLQDVGGGGIPSLTTLQHLNAQLRAHGIQTSAQRLRAFLLHKRGALYRVRQKPQPQRQ